MEAVTKNVFFRDIYLKGGGGRYSETLCEILVAIDFGLENQTFLAKIHIFIPKCTEGRGGYQFKKYSKKRFFTASVFP